MALRDMNQVLVYRSIPLHSLKMFTGVEGETVAADFVKEARRILNNVTDTRPSTEWLLQPLGGMAHQEVLTHLDTNPTANTADLLGILTNIFGENKTIYELRLAFYNKRQGMAEPVLGYAQALEALHRRMETACPSKPEDVDNTLRDAFIHGLYTPSLQRHLRDMVRGNNPATYSAVRTEALRWMREDAGYTMSLEAVSTSSNAGAVATTSDIGSLNDRISRLETALGNLQGLYILRYI